VIGTHLSADEGARVTLPLVRTVGNTNNVNISIRAWDTNSVVDLPNATNLVAEAHYRVQFEAMDGGQILAPQLSKLQGGIVAHADGGSSRIDLPALGGRVVNPKAGSAWLEAANGGSILISNVTELDRIDVIVRGNGHVPLGQVTTFTGAMLSLYNATNSLPGLVNVEASHFFVDDGARLALGGVTQFTRASAGDLRLTARDGAVLDFPNALTTQTPDFYQLEILCENGGRVYLPRLATMQGGITVRSDGAGSLADIAGFAGQFAHTSAGTAWLEASDGGSIAMPNVTQLHRIDLETFRCCRTSMAAASHSKRARN
jgi:hypothetical protein